MKYCADTWFLLNAFSKDTKALVLIEETKRDKTRILVPVVVFAETIKKLMQRGATKEVINTFFAGIESSDKIELIVADKSIAKEAAQISLTCNVPMIDSFVAATCRLYDCDALLSADSDYQLLIKKKYLKVMSW